MLGVHRAVEFFKLTMQTTATSTSSLMLLSLLKDPSILMVLLSLLLVTSTSMITNDYYDARDGVDEVPDANGNSDVKDEYGHYHPLAEGAIPFPIAKTFDSVSIILLLLLCRREETLQIC